MCRAFHKRLYNRIEDADNKSKTGVLRPNANPWRYLNNGVLRVYFITFKNKSQL